jgi:hypothetical protein
MRHWCIIFCEFSRCCSSEIVLVSNLTASNSKPTRDATSPGIEADLCGDLCRPCPVFTRRPTGLHNYTELPKGLERKRL